MGQEAKEHPLAARVMHWIHLVSMTGLGISGFYIHRPFFSGAMGVMRYLHFVCMYVVLLNLVARIYWAFVGEPKDFCEFVVGKKDLRGSIPTIKYYLFLKKDHLKVSKYNPLQKFVYSFWTVLLIAQGLTGFSLYQPALEDKLVGPLFNSLNRVVGGAASMRVVHYLIMWVFIVTVAIHIYLSLVEDFSTFLLMFFGLEKKEV